MTDKFCLHETVTGIQNLAVYAYRRTLKKSLPIHIFSNAFFVAVTDMSKGLSYIPIVQGTIKKRHMRTNLGPKTS